MNILYKIYIYAFEFYLQLISVLWSPVDGITVGVWLSERVGQCSYVQQ